MASDNMKQEIFQGESLVLVAGVGKKGKLGISFSLFQQTSE